MEVVERSPTHWRDTRPSGRFRSSLSGGSVAPPRSGSVATFRCGWTAALRGDCAAALRWDCAAALRWGWRPLVLLGVLGCFLVSGCGTAGEVEESQESLGSGDVSDFDLPDALTQRHGHRMERIADTIYILGGYVKGRATADLFSVDLRTGRHKPLAPMLHPRAFFGSTVIDGVLYVVGDGAERYLPSENCWEFVAGPGSFPRSHFATASLGTVLCTLGGFPEERGRFTALDTATSRQWHPPSPPDFDPGDHFHFMTGTARGLHVVGGFDHQAYDGETAHWFWDGEEWAARAPLPTGDAAKFGTEVQDRRSWYLFGMYGGYRYHFDTDTWSELPTFPTFRAMSASAVRHRSLIVIGGKTPGKEPSVLVFDLDTEKWVAR